MRGRKPTPPALRVLTGNPGHRPPRQTPKPQPKAPECPPWLNAEAKREWNRLAPDLERLGLLTVLDGDMFAVYCLYVAEFHLACSKVAELGFTQTSKRGGLTTSPWVRIMHTAADMVRSFGSEFGLSPTSRTRISIKPLVDDDVSDGILS